MGMAGTVEATVAEAMEAVITEVITAVTGGGTAAAAMGVDTTAEAIMADRTTAGQATTTDITITVPIITTGPRLESLSVLADTAGMATADIIIMDAGRHSVPHSQGTLWESGWGGRKLCWARLCQRA
jgi:hypothetical protein